MCGRYYIERETPIAIRRITGQIFNTDETAEYQKKDVCPSEEAVVVCGQDHQLHAQKMHWGFPSGKSSGLMINARAETALSKISFADSIRNRRCVIPAAGFYEWDKEKNKASFSYMNHQTIYMAGFFKKFMVNNKAEDCFIIITRPADSIVGPVHDRMPLIFEENELRDWIWDDEKIDYWLKKQASGLQCRKGYEQITLPFL